MNEMITRNEVLNDGMTIHLYFNGLVGLYAAYGVSAFLLCRTVEASASYSIEMQMPVVVLNAARYEQLRQRTEVVRDVQNYRCLRTVEPMDEEKYAAWAGSLRADAYSVSAK